MKKILLLLLSLFTAVSFAAKSQPQKLTIMLDWLPNPDHAPLIIAKQLGYFSAQGLDVELISPTDPTDPTTSVASGKADIGITYEPELMAQIDQGQPLIRIGTLIDKPLDCLVVLKDSGIKTLADLKGKRIGTTTGSGLSEAMLKVMLLKGGLNEKDIELINLHQNLTQALLSHHVDAVTGMLRNFEVPQIELNEQKAITFYPEEHGMPNYSELVMISNTNKVHDSRLPRFLAAVKQAVRYLDEHPQLAWQQYTKTYPESNNSVNRDAWFVTIPYFAEDPANFHSKQWHKFAVFMHENKLIKKIQPASRYAVVLRQG